jgi:formimidoylglutamate deiminase
MSALIREYPDSSRVGFGIAPHSLRAVPLDELREIAAWNRAAGLPLHMHVSEQVAENAACIREYGVTPVQLLNREGILSSKFTGVHAIHVTPGEIGMIKEAGAVICACPTTERNLGDGIFAADMVMDRGIRVALGSDSQTQIDPLEDARELEYHLRLQQQRRAILDQRAGKPLVQTLFECATIHGAHALGVPSGELKPGAYADFFTVDLNEMSIAGNSAEDLLSTLVFSLNRSAIRDVFVNGRMILRDQEHVDQDEIVSRYGEVYRKVWANRTVAGARR